MSRCKCCDVILLDRELRRTKANGTPEDLCSDCSYFVHLDLEDLLTVSEYSFGHLTENVLALSGYDFYAEISGSGENM